MYVDSSSAGEEDGGGPQQRLYCRRGSMPEREIDEEDTETAELQSNLRRLAAAKTMSQSLPQLVTAADTMAGAGQRARNKTIFRPVSGALRAGRGRGGGVSGGARGGGLRRSRTWQGFTNGLRYE